MKEKGLYLNLYEAFKTHDSLSTYFRAKTKHLGARVRAALKSLPEIYLSNALLTNILHDEKVNVKNTSRHHYDVTSRAVFERIEIR